MCVCGVLDLHELRSDFDVIDVAINNEVIQPSISMTQPSNEVIQSLMPLTQPSITPDSHQSLAAAPCQLKYRISPSVLGSILCLRANAIANMMQIAATVM